MNLQKISIIFVVFSFSFLMIGSVKSVALQNFLREGIIEKNNFMNSVRASHTNVMDDFRGERFAGLSPYKHKNLRESLSYSEDRLLEYEKNEIFEKIYHEMKEQGSKILVKGSRLNRNGFRNKKMGWAEMNERSYFFGYVGRYHRREDCERGREGKAAVFSSMEEAARNGFFPCEHCILGIGR